MNSQEQVDRASRAIFRGLQSGIPFLQFGDGHDALRVCYRAAGEEINDADCEHVLRATQSGVFKRCPVMRGDQTSYTYLRICGLDPSEIRAAFRNDLLSMSHTDIESIPVDAAFQVTQHENAIACSRSRQVRMDVC